MRPDDAGGLANPYDGPGSAVAAARWPACVTRAVVAGVIGVGASVGLAAAGGTAHADEVEVGTGSEPDVPDVVAPSEEPDGDRFDVEPRRSAADPEPEPLVVLVPDRVVVPDPVPRPAFPSDPEPLPARSVAEPVGLPGPDAVLVPDPDRVSDLVPVEPRRPPEADPVRAPEPVFVIGPDRLPESGSAVGSAVDRVGEPELDPAFSPVSEPESASVIGPDRLPEPGSAELVPDPAVGSAVDRVGESEAAEPVFVSAPDRLPASAEPVLDPVFLPEADEPEPESGAAELVLDPGTGRPEPAEPVFVPAPNPLPAPAPLVPDLLLSGEPWVAASERAPGWLAAPAARAAATRGAAVVIASSSTGGATAPGDADATAVRDPAAGALPDLGTAGGGGPLPSPALQEGAGRRVGGRTDAPVLSVPTWSVSARDLLPPPHDPHGLRAPVAGAWWPTTGVATTGVVASSMPERTVLAVEAPGGRPPDLLALDGGPRGDRSTTTAWTTAQLPGAPVDGTGAPAAVVVPTSTRDVVQVDFAPDGGDSRGTGVVLDPSSVDPSLRIPGSDGEASYVLTVKHGLPIDSRGEIVGPVQRIAVLRPRGTGEQAAQPLPGTVAAVRVSGTSDLALLVVHGERTGLGAGSRVAAAEPEVGTAVGYVGVNPTGETVTGSGRILQGPRNMPLGSNTGTRWGNVVTTSIPPQVRGNSGGPLLDADGEVIGVLAGFDTGVEALIYGGNTYFISTGDLLRFLRDQRDSTVITLPSTARTGVVVPQP